MLYNVCRNSPACSPEHSWRLRGLVSHIIERVSLDKASTWAEGIGRLFTLHKRKNRKWIVHITKMLQQ